MNNKKFSIVIFMIVTLVIFYLQDIVKAVTLNEEIKTDETILSTPPDSNCPIDSTAPTSNSASDAISDAPPLEFSNNQKNDELVRSEPIITESNANQISPRLLDLDVGTSTLTGNYTTGACGQGVTTINYKYVPLVAVGLNTVPILAVQIPSEMATQLVGNTAKQALFLKNLTGNVTYPTQSILGGTSTAAIQATDKGFTLTYNESLSAVVITFPKTSLSLGLLIEWSVNMSIDTVALYKNGIVVPPAINGTNYPIKGTMTSASQGINLTIGLGNTKAGSINTPSMGLGSCPILAIKPPVINDTMQHGNKSITGTINQTKDPAYTYTADITLSAPDGSHAPIVTTGVLVDSSGNFSTNATNAYEYGDTVTAVLNAKAITGTDQYQSTISNTATVKWPIVAPTLTSPTVGNTQITGTAIQTVTTGLYQVAVTVNNQTTIVPLNANGTFALTGVTPLKGGDQVSVVTQGISSRTASKVLITSTSASSTVAFVTPQLTVTQVVEKWSKDGTWIPATSAVTNQQVRFTMKVQLQNNNAIWDNQLLLNWIPSGLTNLTNPQVSKVSSTGVSTVIGIPIVVPQSSSPSGTAYQFQNVLVGNNLVTANEALILQYTATVAPNAANTTLGNSFFVNGTNGGGTAIAQQSTVANLPIGEGTLRLVSVPSQISFGTVSVPTDTKIYNPTSVTNALSVADGRVQKAQWHLYVRETQPLTAGINVLNQVLIYSKAGQDIPLNQSNQEIYTATSTDDNATVIQWPKGEGIRLKIGPNPNIKSGQSYQGKLEWNLSDAPI
ncbi:WxL domain-containing protein [Carnobacterium divergens]|uniref:WxL domain-containing protein n=1 Tax=Carnobacterium divergens TaxID=2748 RepID=UPI0039AF0A30